MQRLINARRFVLWLILGLALVTMTVGTLYAAGEELARGAVLSGGSTRSSNGFIMRDVIGLTAAGSYISRATGVGLCSGFGCEVHSKIAPDDPDDPGDPDDPDDPDVNLYMPQITGNKSNQ